MILSISEGRSPIPTLRTDTPIITVRVSHCGNKRLLKCFIDTIIIVFPGCEGICSPIKSFDHSVTIIEKRNDAENSREYP